MEGTGKAGGLPRGREALAEAAPGPARAEPLARRAALRGPGRAPGAAPRLRGMPGPAGPLGCAGPASAGAPCSLRDRAPSVLVRRRRRSPGAAGRCSGARSLIAVRGTGVVFPGTRSAGAAPHDGSALAALQADSRKAATSLAALAGARVGWRLKRLCSHEFSGFLWTCSELLMCLGRNSLVLLVLASAGSELVGETPGSGFGLCLNLSLRSCQEKQNPPRFAGSGGSPSPAGSSSHLLDLPAALQSGLCAGTEPQDPGSRIPARPGVHSHSPTLLPWPRSSCQGEHSA